MQEHYQAKHNNPYYIYDKNIYMQMIYMIKDYPELKKRRERILHGSPDPPDGQPKGTKPSNPTEQKALILCTIDAQIKAIEQVIIELRSKYSKTYTGETFDAYEAFMDYGVFCYYRSKPGRDTAPCDKTWRRYRQEFVYKLAKKINYF